MRVKRLVAGVATALAMVTGGALVTAPQAQAAPLPWYGPVKERSGQAEFWIVGVGPTDGYWAMRRYGGIYRVVLQQKDENRYGPDRFSSWKTIGAIRAEVRHASLGYSPPFRTWKMGWGSRWADFRICRQESKWYNTRQVIRDCSAPVRMFGPDAPRRPRGGGNCSNCGGRMEYGA